MQECARRGFRWIATEREDTPAGVVDEFRSAAKAAHVLAGVWESAPDFGSSAHAADGYDFYIGQVEGPGQYDRVVSSIGGFRQAHPNTPAAVVTNFGGLETAEKAKPFVDAGWTCIVEAHVKEDGVPPEDRMWYAANVLKWPSPQPMVGLGNGATMADYPNFGSYVGGSVFTAERLFEISDARGLPPPQPGDTMRSAP